jgi:predicted DNA-binding transcriptional regulator YafY
MPSNKNALTRYMFLDEMLSNRHHFYDINDLTNKCNEKLINAGLPTVTRRCIEKDIYYLEFDPFFAEIERFRINGKRCLKYADPSFSIFHKQLTKEESNLIIEVLNTIGQFDGLTNFEWLEKFKTGLDLKERPKVISFSNNPYLQNTNLLGVLFDYISNQVVLELEYHRFNDQQNKTTTIYPYLLKQYNNRWYLICAATKDMKILNFALDRIDSVKPLPEKVFIPCEYNLTERFEDIVGVTLNENTPIEHITFWVSNKSKDYVTTKPIHESQKSIKEELDNIRQKYNNLDEGAFFSIDCIPNYELIRELSSYGKELLVLEPTTIQDEIFNNIKQMYEDYLTIRK